MKRYLIAVSLALGVLVVAWTAFGQEEGGSARRRGGGPSQNVSAEERAKMRERFQNMSEEEREKFRAQMRERFGSRRPRLAPEDQLKSIKVIEAQLAKMKASIEASGTGDRPSFQDMSEEERTKLRERFAKVRAERQSATQAIMAELAKLQGRMPPAEGERLLLISSGDLKPIHELAVKEKATETAQRLERLMAGGGRMRFGPRQPGAAPRGGQQTER